MVNSVRARFARDTGWQVAHKVYTMLLSLIIGALTARYLGPGNYGLIGYGASLVAIFTSISTLGMEGVVVNDLIKHRESNGKLLGTAAVMRLFSSTLSMFLVALLVVIIEPGNELLRWVTVFQSFALVLNVSEVFGYWFKSNLQSKYISIAGMIASTAVGIWRVILLVQGTDVLYFAASSCVMALASGFVIVYAFYKNKQFRLSFDFKTAGKILGRSYHFILSGLAIVLYTQVDKVMIGNMIGETQVGYYTAAATIAALWEFVPLAIITSGRTLIFESKENNPDEYMHRIKMLLAGITLLGLIVGIFFTIFGGIVIRILYGEAFGSAVNPLRIIIWSTLFAMIGSARGSTWIVAENYNAYSKYYAIFGSIVNISLNLLLIPEYGTIGAAMATLVSQITVAFIAPSFFPKTRQFSIIYIESVKMIPNLIKRGYEHWKTIH